MASIRRGGKGGKAGKFAKQTTRYWGIAPSEPTITNVTKVSSSWSNAQYDITFVPGTGVGATAESFTISAYNPTRGTLTFTATSSPYRVTGLSGGSTWTFKIKANATIGQANQSSSSNEVEGGSDSATTVPEKVGKPTASSPSAGTDSVSWSAPDNGGSAITSYDWESTDGKSGNTSSTSVSVGQEQGTAQQYRVRANNALGSGDWSDYSDSVTTTFSFVPFSVFGFSPFSVFGFSPFSVFGFSPFGFSPFSVFGFSPFSVFGFSPFGFSPFGFSPFGFSPFGFSPFGFSPGCIHEDTLITVQTEDGGFATKAAKDCVVNDRVWAGTFDENVDESIADPYSWTTESVTNMSTVSTRIANLQSKQVNKTMTINNDPSKKYSLEQGIFVKRDNVYSYKVTEGLEVGDYVIAFNPESNTFSEVLVESIEVIDGDATVYKFDCEPTDTLIAGNLFVHNLKFY